MTFKNAPDNIVENIIAKIKKDKLVVCLNLVYCNSN